MYEPRTYRHWVKTKDLISFNIVVKETDLYIRASTNLSSKARKLVLKYRNTLERYIERHPAFLTSLKPLPTGDDAPRIVKIIVENGGDIYLKTLKKRVIGIYAGKSPLTGRIGLEINGAATPLGICTSSGTVGHSLSYGKVDAVVVLSQSATLADAAATAIGNLIVQPSDIPSGIEFAKGIEGLKGLLIIKDAKVGLWGEVKVCEMSRIP